MIFKCGGIRDSMIDGKGMALVVYFQGCSIRCPDCHNKEMWDKEGGFDANTSNILNYLDTYSNFYNSLVLQGGEPLDQVNAVVELAKNSKLYNALYTGYEVVDPSIAMLFDMVISGPYIESLKYQGVASYMHPASSNQRVFYPKER